MKTDLRPRAALLLASCLTLALAGCEVGLSTTVVDDPDPDPADEPETDPGTDDPLEVPEEELPDDDDAASFDADGDGYGSDVDCDDSRPDVHPGAEEVACDSVDNNCDGEFLPDDHDSDGDGSSPCFGDCDDSDPGIQIGAPEVSCDGVDQDCDGADACDEDPVEDDPVEEDPVEEDPVEEDPTEEDPVDDPAPTAADTPCGGATPLPPGPAASTLDASDLIYGEAPGWYHEVWQITVDGPGLAFISLVSSDFDAYVEVYDADCVFVGSDDDGLNPFGGTDAGYTLFPLGPGEVYYAFATTSAHLETGAYLIEVL